MSADDMGMSYSSSIRPFSRYEPSFGGVAMDELAYQNISMCCEGLIKKTNFSGPLNICYNKDGNSSFSSCYEQRLSNSESTEIGVLAVMGILFILGLVGGTLAILISCICGSNSRMCTRNGGYKSMN